MKTTNFGSVHQYAQCTNCDWDNAEYENGTAKRKARAHAKETGHTVNVETGTSTMYEGSK